ncbi:MAG: fructosamine kinase family protein [Pseudomonadota bacterium]
MTPSGAQWQALASAIADQCGTRIKPASATAVSGGCIHTALKVDTSDGPLFLKLNDASMADNLAAERTGLDALAASNTLRVPRPLGTGESQGIAWLAMEWLDLTTAGGSEASHRLGLGLAALHAAPAQRFGFDSDNVIGASPQPNGWCDTWPSFVRKHRIQFQLELAACNGFRGELQAAGKALLERLDGWSAAHIRPALQHGDLWGGNWGVIAGGEPVVFDPAVFYGDPEADIAMTRLFGGFDKAFYDAYRSVHPNPEDGEFRRQLYALYHVLNHLNLFGGGYLGQALTLLRKLVQT